MSITPSPLSTMPSPTSNRRALIAGGSLAGLFAGTLLRQQGWSVEIFERSPRSLESQGAGLVQQPDLERALRSLGIAAVEALGVTAFERVTLDRQGRFIAQDRSHQTQHAWDRIYRLLRERFPEAQYHLGRAVTGLAQNDKHVRLDFADGGSAVGDLLIGADGTLSAVRDSVAPAVAPRYAGYVAWRGLIPETALNAEAHQDLAGRFAFYRLDGSHILGYLVPGADGATEPGARRYNWVWYRQAPAGAPLARLLTDRNGLRHRISMTPDRLDPAVAAEMQAAAADLLPPAFAEAVAATPAPFIQAIHDLQAPRLLYGRVALIGDAAAVVRPHTARGIDKAAGDAITLAQALAARPAPLPEALQNWEIARLTEAQAIVRYGRRLGAPLEPERNSQQA